MRVPLSKNERISGNIPYYGATGIIDYVEKHIFDEQLVLIGEDGAKWGANENSAFSIKGKAWVNNHAHVLRPNRNKILDKYLIEILNKYDLSSYITGQNVPKLNQANLNSIQLPLPPLDIQQKIVDEIEDVEKKSIKQISHINKLKKEINIIINNDINSKNVPLSDVATMKAGQNIKNPNIISENNGHLYPCFGGNGIRGYLTNYSHEGIYPIIGRQGALCGNVCLASGKFYATEHAIVVTPKKNVSVKWLYHKLISLNLNQYAKGTAQPGLSVQNILKLSLDVPPLPEQQKIVAKIEKLEKQIAEAQAIIDNSKQQKQAILDKYLK